MKTIPGKALLQSSFPHLPITSDFALEGLPNRDSMIYCDTYDLDSSKLRTVIRGTLRYPGFASLMHSFRELGFLDQSTPIHLASWTDFINKSLSVRYNAPVAPPIQDLIAASGLPDLLDALNWLGLIPALPVSQQGTSRAFEKPGPMPPLPKTAQTALDIFAYLLSHKLRYAPHERDMVVLAHEIISRDPTRPSLPETAHHSTLITYGDPQLGTAMSRTVGIPVAIAALRVAEGMVPMRGVHGPMDRSVWEPVLEGLEEVGLGMKETSRAVGRMDAAGVVGCGEMTVEQALVLGGQPRDAKMSLGLGDSLRKGGQLELGGRFA